MAKQFKVPDTAGALVQDVTPGGPADKAGIKNGDVIRKLNGQTVESNSQLTAMVTNMNPGTEVRIDLIRDGQPMTVQVRSGERPSNLGVTAGAGRDPAQGTLRGITVQTLTPEIRVEKGVDAVIITDLISMAFDDNYDLGILISGDADHAPAVQYIQRKTDKQIVQAFFKAHGDELRNKCWDHVFFDDLMTKLIPPSSHTSQSTHA